MTQEHAWPILTVVILWGVVVLATTRESPAECSRPDSPACSDSWLKL